MSVTAGSLSNLLQLAHYTWYIAWYRDINYKILNGFEDIDRNVLFKYM